MTEAGSQPPPEPTPAPPPPDSGDPKAERRSIVRLQAGLAILLVLVLVACYELFAHRASKNVGSSPPVMVTGVAQNRPVPSIALTTETGRPTSLAALRGKVVVLAPFATLCGTSCAATTSAFNALRVDLRAAGMADRVALVEVSVDPAHDSPARLASFAQVTGSTSQLLTGSAAAVGELWKYLGLFYQVGPPSKALPREGLGDQPATYGVSYADAVYFLGADGHLRIADFAPAQVRLDTGTRHLLSTEGVAQPASTATGWTVSQALGNIEFLLNTRIPLGR